jgi:hypothetical protein
MENSKGSLKDITKHSSASNKAKSLSQKSKNSQSNERS